MKCEIYHDSMQNYKNWKIWIIYDWKAGENLKVKLSEEIDSEAD